MKKTIALMAAAACTVSLCSCSLRQVYIQDDTSAITFSWWGNDVRNEYTIDGIRTFENENKDVSVTPEYSEFGGFKSKMDMEVYSDTEADVMQLNYDWLYEYSPNGDEFYDLYELSDYIDLSNFNDADLSFGKVDGKLNGIAMSLNTITFYTNKSLYDSYGLEIPKTWDDYFEAAKVMKRDEIYPLELSEKTFWLCCTAYYEQTTGRSVFDENNNFNYTEEDLQAVIEFYMRLVNEKVSKRAEDFKRADFANCLCGGMPSWISDADYYFNPAQEYGLDVVVGDCPVTSNYVNFGWYRKPTSLYAIKKDTTEPETAARLVNFLLNSEEMYSLQGTEKGIPMSKSALETLAARDSLGGLQYEATQKMNSQNNIKSMSPCLENSELIDFFTEACDAVYYKKLSVETAASRYWLYMKTLFE